MSLYPEEAFFFFLNTKKRTFYSLTFFQGIISLQESVFSKTNKMREIDYYIQEY